MRKDSARVLMAVGIGAAIVLIAAIGAAWWILRPAAQLPPAPAEQEATPDLSGAPPGSDLQGVDQASAEPIENVAPPALTSASAAPAQNDPAATASPPPDSSLPVSPPAPAASSAQMALAEPSAPGTPPPASPPAAPAATAPEPPVTLAMPQPPPEMPASGGDDAARYISAYDGGACFFAAAMEVGDGSASVEAFAESIPPVEALDASFKRDNGFEAQIGFRQVTAAQCPAVDFLRAVRPESGRAPTVALESHMVHDGSPLLGRIGNVENRSLAVLLVTDEGAVHNLSDTVRAESGSATFAVSLHAGASGDRVKPLLIMVIASPAPLSSLAPASMPPAPELFPRVADEARRSGGVSAALEYLKLES
jgi:serine/threonine-protein kinase